MLVEKTTAIEMERAGIQSVQKQLHKVQQENNQLMDERQIHQYQLKSFAEDFDQEKQEKLKTKQELEKSLTEYQLTIRKLTDEVRRLVIFYA